MTNLPTDTPPKATAKQKSSRLQDFLKAGEKLSPEEREKLMDFGIVLPVDVDSALAGTADKSRYGYYCKLCGSVALYFIGESFVQPDGTKGPIPPHSMPIQQIPFAQPGLPRDRINRNHPICQHCCNPIEMKFGRLNVKRIIHVEPWRRAKHAAVEKMKAMHVPAHSVQWDPGRDSDGKRADFSERNAGPLLSADEKAVAEQVLNPESLAGRLPNTPSPTKPPK